MDSFSPAFCRTFVPGTSSVPRADLVMFATANSSVARKLKCWTRWLGVERLFADSARITGVAASSSDSAFVWYSVANAAAGARDSLYLKGRSLSDTTVAYRGTRAVNAFRNTCSVNFHNTELGLELARIGFSGIRDLSGYHDKTFIRIGLWLEEAFVSAAVSHPSAHMYEHRGED